MNLELISQVLEHIDTEYIDEATLYPHTHAVRHGRKKYLYLSIAASLVLILTSVVILAVKSTAPGQPPGWDIVMANSTAPTYHSESLPPITEQDETSQGELSPTVTGSTFETTPTDPTGSIEPTGSTEPTNSTEPTEPSSSQSGSDISPPPQDSGDGEFLDFVTDGPISLSLIPNLQAGGGEFYLMQPAFPEILLLERAQGDIYPIYQNPYPVDHGGPQYEITEEFIAGMQRSLSRYLTLIWGEGNYTGTYNPDIPYVLSYEQGGLSFVAGAESVNVTSTAYSPYSTLTPEDLYANPLFRAALSYCGITTPTITAEIEYNIYGEISNYNYIVTEATDDPQEALLKRIFSSVTIRSYTGENLLSLSVRSMGRPAEVGITTLASTEDIESYLLEAYPELSKKPHTIQVFYSTRARQGYYLPSYRIYFEEAELSEEYRTPAYTILELTDARFPG
ncbi:MAG: hypothetical protein IKM59_02685 [Oscillospiraceae bacterium]|nr:hypothetical protein [Oscillospiraceae bacterium]